MAMEVSKSIDEEDVAHAIRIGDLQLEWILQHTFAAPSETTEQLTQKIIHLTGTHQAGVLTERFAKAMQET
ncbi:hypothetical protein [Pseudovibrio sp. POLY-S9]|uniref:hypothetical protein n=1 Tax=Pseudovibrio sp. POLY-S9 TaxID=1576596 RepID=UPI00070EDAB3|nr:hypothetical protein [Pseudovibrio sp. POLY-S9]